MIINTKARIFFVMLCFLQAIGSAQAALYTETFNGINTQIPDGNSTGVTFYETVSDVPPGATVEGLTVGLNVSGGINGDLYAYLVSPNGKLVKLMDQPGLGVNNMGAYGSGMNITLQDGTTASGSIQSVTSGSVLSGTYNAEGCLANFDGSAADGTWTLFFADLASGPDPNNLSVLNSWSLGITAVPEPVTQALIIFGAVCLLIHFGRWCRLRLRDRRLR
jgi:subtilisin-like proprotein convertase family protein